MCTVIYLPLSLSLFVDSLIIIRLLLSLSRARARARVCVSNFPLLTILKMKMFREINTFHLIILISFLFLLFFLRFDILIRHNENDVSQS